MFKIIHNNNSMSVMEIFGRCKKKKKKKKKKRFFVPVDM